MKPLLPILTLGLMLASCEIPFEIEQEGEAKIYVQCVAGRDGVFITPQYAAPIGEKAPENINYNVQLQINGQSAEVTLQDGNCFANHTLLREGDEVEVEIRAEGLPAASGHTRLVYSPRITDLLLSKVETADGQVLEQVGLVLDRAPSADEHYAIQIINKNQVIYSDGSVDEYVSFLIPSYIRSEVESLTFDLEDYVQVDFDGRRLACDGYRPLTLLYPKHFQDNKYYCYLGGYDEEMLDQIRDGMPAGDTGMVGGGIISGDIGAGGPGEGEGQDVDPERTPLAQRIQYRFVLYNLSDEFFYFFKALYQSNFDFLSNMGLTPANFTYSNVSGGLGMVGAVGRDSIDFEVVIPLFEN